ncbi:hypothetical protein V2G26_005228 [Clonostachys chloroleuca]
MKHLRDCDYGCDWLLAESIDPDASRGGQWLAVSLLIGRAAEQVQLLASSSQRPQCSWTSRSSHSSVNPRRSSPLVVASRHATDLTLQYMMHVMALALSSAQPIMRAPVVPILGCQSIADRPTQHTAKTWRPTAMRIK